NCRTPTIADGSLSRSRLFLAAMFLVLGLQGFEIIVEAVEAFLPEFPVALEPVVDALERRGLQPARPPLRFAPARDQPGPFQHLEVLRDRRPADVEGFRTFSQRRL